jgi:alkanesulfonate monooxygenase
MKLLWYLSTVDGRLPWTEEGRFEATHRRLRLTAEQIDNAGFYGVLYGTYSHDVWTALSSIIPATERLRFLIPIYPGVVPPPLLAKQALTFDTFSNGRLLFNLVNGSDQILREYGVNLGHDERYEMSAEYWTLFKRLYRGESFAYKSKYFDFETRPVTPGNTINLPLDPAQIPNTPLWGAGASAAGQAHAGAVVDTYLTMFPDREILHEQLNGAHAAAAGHGRELSTGVLLSVVVRDTEAEALSHFQGLIDRTGADGIAAAWARARSDYEAPPTALEQLSSPFPQFQSWIDAVRQGRTPTVDELRREGYDHVYTGITGWSQTLPLFPAGIATYVVGSAEQVAQTLHEMQDEFGYEAFILSGWPLGDEAERTAELLFPHLQLDHESELTLTP